MSIARIIVSSYRTYEEWKQNGSMAPPTLPSVLTVPMRNGNNGSFSASIPMLEFLPYL